MSDLEKAVDDFMTEPNMHISYRVSFIQGYNAATKDLQSQVEKLQGKLDVAIEGFKTIKANSHSWIIKQDTAYYEGPIHDRYRNLAETTLNKLKE